VARSARIFIQAGAFSVRDDAQRVKSRIASFGSVQVMTASVKGIELYRVLLGPLTSAGGRIKRSRASSTAAIPKRESSSIDHKARNG
jgi:cell division protein FtsN